MKCRFETFSKILWIYIYIQYMVVEIQCCRNSTNQHVQRPSPAPESSGPPKKPTTSRAGTFWRAHFYPELYLDPGSSSGNTQSTGPKSLVPGESSCSGNGAKVTFTLFLFFILWWKMASILGLSELQGKKSELWEKKSEFRDINSQLLEKIWIWDKSPKYLVLFFYSVAIVNWQKKKKVFFF